MSLINDALKRASEAQQRQPRQPKMPAEIMRPVETPAPAPGGARAVLWCAAFVLVFGLGAWFLWQGWQAGRKPAEVALLAPPKPKPPPTNAIAPATPVVPAKVAPVAVKPAPAPTTIVSLTPPIETKAPTVTNTPPALVPRNPPVETKTPPPVTAPKTVIAAVAPAFTNAPALPAKLVDVPSVPPTEVKPIVAVPPEVKPTPPAVVTPPRVPITTALTAAPKAAPKPAATASVPDSAFPQLKLQGIIYLPSNPSAIISGRTVYAGDKLEEVRVVRVERESVVLEFGGRTNTLHLLR